MARVVSTELVDTGRLVDLTSELVAVATANPPGNERATSEVLRAALAPWAASWQEVEPSPGRLSLLARVPAQQPAPPGGHVPVLIVNAHTDVVPVVPDRWSRAPFEPTVVGDRLYGRGTADMKGGLAAAVRALATLEATGLARPCDIVFQFVADEERGGGLGTRALMDAGLLEADAALVPEPTGLAVCVAERGLLQGRLEVRGRPGHGSRPREGVSAVEHAARLVLAIHAADFGDREHPLLGRPTANVGTVHGGSAVNVVAEQASVGFDRRILPGVTREDAVAGLRAKLDAADLADVDFEMVVDDFGEGSEMSPDHPFAHLVRSSLGLVLGYEPPTIGMSFTTDARFIRNQGGTPAVVCGPGDIAQAHSIDEWVSIPQLVQATAAFATLYASFGPGWATNA